MVATRELGLRCPEARVLVLSRHADRDHVLSALEAGAVGHLLKSDELVELVDCVRAVARDERRVSGRVRL